MISAKEQVRRILDDLPDDATWEEIQYRIYVRHRIERGLEDARCGRLIDQEELERRMDQWLAGSGGRM